MNKAFANAVKKASQLRNPNAAIVRAKFIDTVESKAQTENMKSLKTGIAMRDQALPASALPEINKKQIGFW